MSFPRYPVLIIAATAFGMGAPASADPPSRESVVVMPMKSAVLKKSALAARILSEVLPDSADRGVIPKGHVDNCRGNDDRNSGGAESVLDGGLRIGERSAADAASATSATSSIVMITGAVNRVELMIRVALRPRGSSH